MSYVQMMHLKGLSQKLTSLFIEALILLTAQQIELVNNASILHLHWN